jgi:hypothetical protein
LDITKTRGYSHRFCFIFYEGNDDQWPFNTHPEKSTETKLIL